MPRFQLVTLVLAGLLTACAPALTGFSSPFGNEATLSSSIADADRTTYLDEAVIAEPYLELARQPRDAQGAFLLGPGVYRGELRSFCLRPGTHGPTTGQGYLHAPAKGPLAGMVTAVLQRATLYPEVPQSDVQRLLWAMLSKTKLSETDSAVKTAARALLTDQERLQLQGGALGLIPDIVLNQALARLPAEAQQVLHAENELRTLLTSAQASFEELERLAVLPSQADPQEIRPSHWNYEPAGYYVRYEAQGYSRVLVTVFVPRRIGPEANAAGNVLRLASVRRVAWRANLPAVHFAPWTYLLMPANTGGQRLGMSGAISGGGPIDFNWRRTVSRDNDGAGWYETPYTAGFFAPGPAGVRNVVCNFTVGIPGYVNTMQASSWVRAAGEVVGLELQAQLRGADPFEMMPALST